ncbi:hypothetical protein HOLleu_37796 [Holothuria leucospilota]|uniref:Uncharacterized protein n=1 Tax=Holothuria leucospilota TaxID=206669 RepID=A0A9Q0YPH2_HOLLE|nr:hypothetical protein HOLleu_37796 [Holothuria leucospilota]
MLVNTCIPLIFILLTGFPTLLFFHSRENLVRVKIYFEELNYELVEQVPANSVAEVLGTIGGLLGLCVGFSVITVFEVVILCWHIIKLAIRKALPNVNTMNAPETNSNLDLNNIKV